MKSFHLISSKHNLVHKISIINYLVLKDHLIPEFVLILYILIHKFILNFYLLIGPYFDPTIKWLIIAIIQELSNIF